MNSVKRAIKFSLITHFILLLIVFGILGYMPYLKSKDTLSTFVIIGPFGGNLVPYFLVSFLLITVLFMLVSFLLKRK